MIHYFYQAIYLALFLIFLVDLAHSESNPVPNSIVNRHDFEYIYNPGDSVCNSDVYLLIYVHSATSNFKRRLSLRETWAKRSAFASIRIVFMMGYTEDKKVESKLKLESSVYNDIVQENFIDSYRNLTYKGIMAMKWISEYCNNAKYILKVDDDIITNSFFILRHLKSMDKFNMIKPNSVMCLVWVGMKVQRDKNSKWYLSKEDFKEDYFGKYCSGSAYLFTNDLPTRMYDMSKYIKFFWIDDYYMTGLLTKALNVTFVFFNSIYKINRKLVESSFIGERSDVTTFGHLPGQLNTLYSIWKSVLKKEIAKHPSLIDSNSQNSKELSFSYFKDFFWNRFSLPDKDLT